MCVCVHVLVFAQGWDSCQVPPLDLHTAWSDHTPVPDNLAWLPLLKGFYHLCRIIGELTVSETPVLSSVITLVVFFSRINTPVYLCTDSCGWQKLLVRVVSGSVFVREILWRDWTLGEPCPVESGPSLILFLCFGLCFTFTL